MPVCLKLLLTSLALALGAGAQDVIVRKATANPVPRTADSNSPAFWRDGRLHWFNSHGGPALSTAADQFGPWQDKPVLVLDSPPTPRWVESVWPDEGATLWAWTHTEPAGLVPGTTLTAPRIAATTSTDNGTTMREIGVVLESGEPVNPAALNGYFAGGHGDFSVIADRDGQYFYFFFGNYGGADASQGVCVARMAFDDRKNPVGKVWKFHDGAWREAGLGGKVTPIFPVKRGWQHADPDAFWGPAVHWNTYLNCYVMLLNRAVGEPGWSQEGIYVSFGTDLSRPDTWTAPRKILGNAEFPQWYFFYPQVMGLGRGETDTRAGQFSRLYVGGVSRWEIEFVAPAIAPTALHVAASGPTSDLAEGSAFSLTVTGMGQAPFTYQWHRDGIPILGATGATFSLAAITPADAGAYTVVVANSLGSATNRAVTVAVVPRPPPPPPRPFATLANLSIHSQLADETAYLVVGWTVRGSGPKSIVLRAVGPGLSALGVPDAVADPRLTVFDGASSAIAENDNWLAGDTETFAAVGAFSLPEASTDAALTVAVTGSGTARARATGGGTMLAELYDTAPSEASRIDDVSARGRVSFGSRAMVGGFTVAGSGSMRVLIRALGPHLAQFGVVQPLADPRLEVLNQEGEVIAQNDDWDPALAPVFAEAGSTALAEGSLDAAVVVTAEAGRSYTVAVRRGEGAAGEAMLELHVLR